MRYDHSAEAVKTSAAESSTAQGADKSSRAAPDNNEPTKPSLLNGGEIRVSRAEWWWRLQMNKEGKPYLNIHNVMLVLAFEPMLDADHLRFDELTQVVVGRDLPWDDTTEWRPWTDRDDTWLQIWFQQRFLSFRRDDVQRAVDAVARERAFNPVVAYLDSLEWDGKKRIDNLLHTYFGARAEPAEYLRAVGPMMLLSAVARARQPGCKVDHVLILEGEQGERKSSALRVLAGEPWFADQIAELGTKDAAQDLRGKWIIEDSELASLRGDKVEKRKAFISRQVDHYRPSYGRRSEDFPRRCIVVGTTNNETYLRDVTGNRRFWPVRIGKIELDALIRDRDQIWAEADARYRAGERWWLTPEQETVAREEQDQRREVDPWEEEAQRYIGHIFADHNPRNGGYATVGDFLAFIGKDAWNISQADSMRAANVFRAVGLRNTGRRVPAEVNPTRPRYFELSSPSPAPKR